MAAYIQANTNGRLHPAHEPSLSPLNRGFLYGDAVYEVWRTYAGVLFAWEEHWQRLERSAAALHLPVGCTRPQIRAEIQRTVEAYFAAVPAAAGREVYVRLQISRGAGPIGLDIHLADEPAFVLLVQSNPQWTERQAREGLSLSLAQEMRRNPPTSLNPAWKTGNYLNNILCLREARARGADEVVILNAEGEITEAAVSNLLFVAGDGTLVTPPLAAGILAGITRQLVIERVAGMAGLPVREAAIRPEELGSYPECGLLSSTKDVSPVRAIDATTFRIGPETHLARLKRAFGEYTEQYARAHPELRVFSPPGS